MLYEGQSCASYCSPIEDQVNSFRGLSWKSITVQYSVSDCLDLLTLQSLQNCFQSCDHLTVVSRFPRLKWKLPSFSSGSAVVDLLAGCCYCNGLWIYFIILLFHSISFGSASFSLQCFRCLFPPPPLSHAFPSCCKQAVLLVSRQETAWKDRKDIKTWNPIRIELEYLQLWLGRYLYFWCGN